MLATLVFSLLVALTHGKDYSLMSSGSYRGVDYSAFRAEGPEPYGHHEMLDEKRIREDMKLLSTLGVKWLRTYATDLNADLIPVIAKEHAIETIVGTWVSSGEAGVDFWYKELKRADELFEKHPDLAPIVLVGNEVMYKDAQPVDVVLKMVEEVHKRGWYAAIGDIPPSYLNDTWAEVFKAADILLVHSHPFFSHIKTKDSHRIQHTRLMPDPNGAEDVLLATAKIQSVYPSKLVMVGETGYPTYDSSSKAAVDHCRQCNPANQAAYFQSLFELAAEKNIGVFIFSAFDEYWKGEVGEEAGSGPHWGFFDVSREPKPAADVVAKWNSGNGSVLSDKTALCDVVMNQAECVPKTIASDADLQMMIDFACNLGNVDCDSLEDNDLMSGCSLVTKAAWALTKYYHQQQRDPESCTFGGLATPQTDDEVFYIDGFPATESRAGFWLLFLAAAMAVSVVLAAAHYKPWTNNDGYQSLLPTTTPLQL